MVHAGNEDTEFRDYSSDAENMFFMRRGRLRILISVEKNMKDDEKRIERIALQNDLLPLISILKAERSNEGENKKNAKS